MDESEDQLYRRLAIEILEEAVSEGVISPEQASQIAKARGIVYDRDGGAII